MHSPHSMSGELTPHQFEDWVTIYINYLEFFCMRDLSILSHLFIHLFISVRAQGYLVYSYNPIRLNLFLLLKFLQLWSLGVFSVGSYVPLICSHYCEFSLFFFLSTCLLSDAIRVSRLISCVSCPSHRISHFSNKPWFLFQE